MSGTQIHALAVVEPGAQLGADVHVGPFCHIGSEAVVGDGVHLSSHVVVQGPTTIGAKSRISPHAVLGGLPQSLRHKGGRTTLEIGRNCIIREFVTMNVGTDGSRGVTSVGDNCYFMASSHVAHDCIVGNNVTMANSVALGGHVEVGDFVTLGGLAAVHQFVRIGHHAFVGGLTGVAGDVIPYGMVMGERAKLRGLNVIGMKRSGLGRSDLVELRRAYAMIFDPQRPVSDGLDEAERTFSGSAVVADVVAFLKGRDRRHLTVPPLRDRADDDDSE